MNGSFNITTSNQYIVGTVSWKETNINETNNTSIVTVELRLSRTNNYTSATGYGGYYVVIDGTSTYVAADYDDKITLNSNTLVASASKTITHNTDGSKSITISVYSDGLTIFTISQQSGTARLTTIPRKSSVKAGKGTIGDELRISITRASDSFTHRLSYTFGSLSGTIASNVGEYYDWDIPTSFYAQIPNATSGKGTITCQTYSGSTLIGSSSTSFTAKCNQSACIPSLSATLNDGNSSTATLTGSTQSNPVLVDYKSNAVFNITCSAKNSASITSLKINGYSFSPSAKTVTLENIAFSSITIEAIDSRGYPAYYNFQCTDSSEDNYYRRIRYVDLTINPTTKRSTQISDDMFVTISGNYFKGNFSSTVANTLALSWKVREKNGTWTTGATALNPTISTSSNKYSISNLELTNPLSEDGTWDYQKIYEFEFTATDKLMNIKASDSRPKGQPNFAIFQNVVTLSNGEPISTYNIGDVYITSTNTNPKNTLGYGTWQLIDKEFKSSNLTNAFSKHSDCESCTFNVIRSGHEITIFGTFVMNIDLLDSQGNVGYVDYDEIGITNLCTTAFFTGYCDTANSVLLLAIGPESGLLYSFDVVNAGHTEVAAGNTIRCTLTLTNDYQNMLNSACDKFYWKRTA